MGHTSRASCDGSSGTAPSRIKIARTTDLDTVRDLDRELFKSPLLTDEELDESIWWLGTLGGTAVAFAGITLYPTKYKAFLTRAGVAPIARGAGLQKRLIRTRMRYARSQGIYRAYTYTHAGNHASMRSMIACGLRPYYTERPEETTYIYFENKPQLCQS